MALTVKTDSEGHQESSFVSFVSFLVATKLWQHTPLIPALGRQREVDFIEFKTSLIYRESSRTARTSQRNPVLDTKISSQKKRNRQFYNLYPKTSILISNND